MSDLRTVVVIDYQNLHLTGHGTFPATKYGPRHESLVDPLHFSTQLLKERNSRQKAGHPNAVLRRVNVFRGHPSSDHDPKGYARNLAQQAHWERDKRVSVTLRPLKYRYHRDASGQPVRDPATGIKMPSGPPSEKGVDVLCALALVREAAAPDIDLVILASVDSDLEPALAEVLKAGTAKVETVSWYQPGQPSIELRLADKTKRLWNTRLNETNFLNCLDRTNYT